MGWCPGLRVIIGSIKSFHFTSTLVLGGYVPVIIVNVTKNMSRSKEYRLFIFHSFHSTGLFTIQCGYQQIRGLGGGFRRKGKGRDHFALCIE